MAKSVQQEDAQTGNELFLKSIFSGLRRISGTLISPWDQEVGGGRPPQLPPSHPRSLYWWMTRFWLFLNMSGRGAGKTRSGSEFIYWRRRNGYGRRIALIGQTASDVRDVIVEGESGLLEKAPNNDRPTYEPSKRRLTWKDGSTATCYSGDEPGQLRGPQHDTAWLDEFAKFQKAKETLDNLEMGLRLSDFPCAYLSTTPIPSPEMRELVNEARRWEKHLRAVIGAPDISKGTQLALEVGAWVRRGGDRRLLLLPGDEGPEIPRVILVNEHMEANAANLPDETRRQLKRRFDGTRTGRQELAGELLEDVEGALWTQKMIDQSRGRRFTSIESGRRVTTWMVFDRDSGLWRPVPELTWVVVAVDPATTSGENSDDTGIIAAGLGADEHAYVLEDATCHLSPEGWAQRTIHTYERWMADLVVGEKNNGGDLVESVLRMQQQNVSYASVWASKGKTARAQPVASLYEQGKCHHLGLFSKLEDEMISWVQKPGVASPNRIDSLVWSISKLMVVPGGQWAVRTAREEDDAEEDLPPWVVAARRDRD